MTIVFILIALSYLFYSYKTIKSKNNVFLHNNTVYISLDTILDYKYTLKDFYSYNKQLSFLVDYIYNKLTDNQKISQMIVTSAGKNGKSFNDIMNLIQDNKIGGVLFLGGEQNYIKSTIEKIDSILTINNRFPLIFSIDAEPGLINSRISNVIKFPHARDIKTIKESRIIAHDISILLKYIGFNQNFAPVCDYGFNKEIIGSRSFGVPIDSLAETVNTFIKETQRNNLIATVKHFPGHGNVTGDSHKELVYIDGELKELDVFKKAIDNGVLSVMVGHIAVRNNSKYNTEGKPSSISENIVKKLLKEELNFKGIIVTDAMNMKAISELDRPSLNAIKAGCDMILMPSDEGKLINSIKAEMNINKGFNEQVTESVKKIIRIKLCLGLFDKHLKWFRERNIQMIGFN